jgi:hypothetical protein
MRSLGRASGRCSPSRSLIDRVDQAWIAQRCRRFDPAHIPREAGGGPRRATIMLALYIGKKPIVVPRRQALGDTSTTIKSSSRDGSLPRARSISRTRKSRSPVPRHSYPSRQSSRSRSSHAWYRCDREAVEELVDEMIGVVGERSRDEPTEGERVSVLLNATVRGRQARRTGTSSLPRSSRLPSG